MATGWGMPRLQASDSTMRDHLNVTATASLNFTKSPIRFTCRKHQGKLQRRNSSDPNLAKLTVLKRPNMYQGKRITYEKWTVKGSFPRTLTITSIRMWKKTASHSRNSCTRIKGSSSTSTLQIWTQTMGHTFPSTKTWPNNKFGISTKKEDSLKSLTIHQRPL